MPESPAELIPEQRVVDVWNRYVREIEAPDEALVTADEIHNMRDALFTVAQVMWRRGNQTVWTMPNTFAVRADGKVADGCRALEAIGIIQNLDDRFQNLRSARDRLRKGMVVSDELKKLADQKEPRQQATALFAAHADVNPVRSAEINYVQKHGSQAYQQLLRDLFDDLFPAKK